MMHIQWLRANLIIDDGLLIQVGLMYYWRRQERAGLDWIANLYVVWVDI